MKLLRLHIENFGKLSSYDYTFNSGLNVFCEDNGYGKTTLAAFINAMFYGLPKQRGDKFNERTHYFPFGGGKYGGSLTFEMDGSEYRIERTFDERSETRDKTAVYCNNAPCSGFDYDIGRQVFGIDEKAFKRTVYIFIDSEKTEISVKDETISARLNSIAGGISSDETIKKAVETLSAAAKEYRVDRTKRGKCYDLERDIANLSYEIKRIEGEAAALGGMYGSYNQLSGEVRALEKQKNAAGKAAVVDAQWKTYDSLIEQQQAAQRQYDVIIGAYPHGIPSADEIARLQSYSANIERNKNAMDIKAFGGEQKQRLESLEGRFAAGVPDDGLLEEADKKAMRCHVLEQDIEGLKGMRPDGRLEGLERRFAAGVPDSAAVAAYERKIDALRDTDMKITARMTAGRAVPQAPAPQAKKGGKWRIVLAVIAALMLAGGIVLMFINTIAGGALAIAGAVLLVAAVILLLNGRKAVVNSPDVSIDDTLADLQYTKNKYIEELHAFLAPYGYYSAGVEGDFAALKNDMQTFTELKNNVNRMAKDIADKTAELEKLRAWLGKLLAAYGVTNDNLQAGVRELRVLKDEYIRLCGAQRQADSGVKTAGDEVNASCSAARALLAKYGIEFTGDLNDIIAALQGALKDSARLGAEVKNRQSEAEAYRTKKGLTDRPVHTAESVDIDSLSGLIDEKNRQLAELKRDIFAIEDEVLGLDGLKSSLADMQEELDAAMERYKLLTAAGEMLKIAQQNLKDKYVAPVKDKFTYYANMIEQTLGDKVSMDGSFTVSFERGGAITSYEHLSSGQLCVCDLCFRLALIDNMYTGQQPFIIMDDPFVNLDERHLKDVLKLVKALSKDRQIIYFCCHKSRIA